MPGKSKRVRSQTKALFDEAALCLSVIRRAYQLE